MKDVLDIIIGILSIAIFFYLVIILFDQQIKQIRENEAEYQQTKFEVKCLESNQTKNYKWLRAR
jgi:hypothetical protein